MNIHSVHDGNMDKRQERKERITDQRKQQILDAALTVFSQHGFSEATIPEIAQEAGVAVGTIYNYYQNKRDLLVSLVARHIISEPFINLLEHPLPSDDRGFLVSLVTNRLDFSSAELDELFFLLSEIQHDSQLRQQYVEQVLSPILNLLEQYLESRISSGAFRPANSAVTARMLAGAMVGFILIRRLEGEQSICNTIPLEELTTQMADFALGYLQSSAGGTLE